MQLSNCEAASSWRCFLLKENTDMFIFELCSLMILGMGLLRVVVRPASEYRRFRTLYY